MSGADRSTSADPSRGLGQTGAVPGVYYHDYLQLDRLLGSQDLASAASGGAPAHDEMLFIVIHQTYELWFKQILWELDDVLSCFVGEELHETDIARVIARLQRIVEIQHVLIGQIDVLETMTPLDFLEFRDLLVPASGFQSMQFRLIENKLGVRPEDRVTFGGARYTERLHGEQRERVIVLRIRTVPPRVRRKLARTHTIPRLVRLLERVRAGRAHDARGGPEDRRRKPEPHRR